MAVEIGNGISRRKTVDGRIEKLRIAHDIGNEGLGITVIGDVAASFAGDVHLSSYLGIGIDQKDLMILIGTV